MRQLSAVDIAPFATPGHLHDGSEMGETIVHAPFTDMGNAERLTAEHGFDLRYVHTWHKWIEWDGKRWCVDQSGGAMRRAKQTMRWLCTYASTQVDDDGMRQKLVRHALKSESEPRLRAMLKLAESEDVFAIQASDLNRDAWYLNVTNGTLELEAGKLLPHSRVDLITKIAPVEYRETAECPRFMAFLKEILPDPGVRKFVQRAIGYSLTGITGERCLFILYGGGANGKSTLLEIVHTMLGDYANAVNVSMLMAQRQDGRPRPDLVRLVGARLITTTEVEENHRLAESLVKQLTGSDTIAARDLYAGAASIVEFVPTFKVWMATNHKPTITGTDNAIWDRIRLIPFDVSIPPERQNRNLLDELREELPGILAWAVEGCRAWRSEGLMAPEAVCVATKSYRDEMDTVARFLDEQCVVTAEGRVRAKDLYSSYRAWSEECGERPMTQKVFGQQLTEHRFSRKRGKHGYDYLGVTLQQHAGGVR